MFENSPPPHLHDIHIVTTIDTKMVIYAYNLFYVMRRVILSTVAISCVDVLSLAYSLILVLYIIYQTRM